MKVCSIDGCGKAIRGKGLCAMHWFRLKRHGDAEKKVRRNAGEGGLTSEGYLFKTDENGRFLDHVRVAELAIGRKLPKGAIVHHWDENKANNRNENLLVCPNNKYHMLIHQRMRAMKECGNPNWRKCSHCRKYGDPAGSEMESNGSRSYRHVECRRAYTKRRKECSASGQQ